MCLAILIALAIKTPFLPPKSAETRGKGPQKAAPPNVASALEQMKTPMVWEQTQPVFVNVAKSLGTLGGKRTFHTLGKSLSKLSSLKQSRESL